MRKHVNIINTVSWKTMLAGILAMTVALLLIDSQYGAPVSFAQSNVASTDATLSALTLSNIDFGTFDPETLEYTAQVFHGITQTHVTATRNHPKPKPRWDVHLAEVGDGSGSLAVAFRPLIAGLYGSGV